MYRQITENEFIDEMMNFDFTSIGASALYEYLTDIEDASFSMEFDPVAISMQYSEYTIKDLAESLDNDILQEILDENDDQALVTDLQAYIVAHYLDEVVEKLREMNSEYTVIAETANTVVVEE